MRRILIVDDEETIALGITNTLNQTGQVAGGIEVQADYVTSGFEAIEALDGGAADAPYDLVITDIKMPGMTGIELLKNIRLKHPSLGVIVITAYGSREVQKDANRRGSLFFIEKPFDIELLKDVIGDYFRKLDGLSDSNGSGAMGNDDGGSFVGKVGNLQLMDVIQMNCLGRITCTLVVDSAMGHGIICFNRGDIIHAETAAAIGKDAFFSIIGWPAGSFDMRDDVPNIVTIIDSWEQLMIEAMSQEDQANGSAGGGEADDDPFGAALDRSFRPEPAPTVLPPRSTPPFTPPAATPGAGSGRVTTRDWLDEAIARVAGTESAFLVAADGFVLDRRSRLPGNLAAVDEAIRGSISALATLGREAQAGALDAVTVAYGSRRLVLRPVPQSDLLIGLIGTFGTEQIAQAEAVLREAALALNQII